MAASLSLRDVLLQDFWVHMAGLIAIALGASDIWYFHAFARDSDLLFMVGGFGAMGLKIINGSAAALRTAALDTAFAASRAAKTAVTAAEVATGTPSPDSGAVLVVPAAHMNPDEPVNPQVIPAAKAP